MNPKLITEFFGTFFLLVVISLTGSPAVIGAVLMILVYAGGHISGAHFNPAVTIALYILKKISSEEALKYIGAQLLGGLAAVAVYFFIRGTYFIVQPTAHTPFLLAFFVEVLFTFLLMRVIMMVAVDPRVKGNHYFGVAIGAAVFVGASVAGPISGGAFNPVVGLAPLLFNPSNLFNNLSLVLLYALGPVLGAALAVVTPDIHKKH